MNYTKEIIQEKIRTDIAWTIRTLEVLYLRQTEDEQENSYTSHKNGMGFNGTDSNILTSIHNQIIKRKKYNNQVLLSDKQIEICRKLLPKYWKQVKEEIELRKANQ
jgi:hypothetical protein